VGDGAGEAVSRRADDRVVGPGSGDPAAVGIGEAVCGPAGDRVVGLGSGAVGVGEGSSGRTGDRVRLCSGADADGDGVSPRSSDRVGLGSVAVGLGVELGKRDDVVVARTVGRSIEPVSPQQLRSSAATARPTARITSGSNTAPSDPAFLVTLEPFDHHLTERRPPAVCR
jgi:hypothetical protein